MDQQRLIDLLQQLRAALMEIDDETGAQLSESTRESMRTVQRELQRVAGPVNAAAGEEARTVTESLREAMVDFEAEHPQLTSLVGRLSEALANLGI